MIHQSVPNHPSDPNRLIALNHLPRRHPQEKDHPLAEEIVPHHPVIDRLHRQKDPQIDHLEEDSFTVAS